MSMEETNGVKEDIKDEIIADINEEEVKDGIKVHNNT